jgi:hypothetical protein
MLAAEKRVRPADRKYHWSKTLDQAGYCVRYWKICLSDIRNHSSSSPSLKTVHDRAGIDLTTDDSTLSPDTIVQKLQAATMDLKDIQ